MLKNIFSRKLALRSCEFLQPTGEIAFKCNNFYNDFNKFNLISGTYRTTFLSSSDHRAGSEPWTQIRAACRADRHLPRWMTSSCPPWRSPSTASQAPCLPHRATLRQTSRACVASPPPTRSLSPSGWPRKTANFSLRANCSRSASKLTAVRGKGCTTSMWPWTGSGRSCPMRTDRRCVNSPKSPPCCWLEITFWCWATHWRRWNGWWARSTAAADTTVASTRQPVGLWHTRGPCRDTRRLPTPHTQQCTTRSSHRRPSQLPLWPRPASPLSHQSGLITDSLKRPVPVQGRWAAVSSTGASELGCRVRAACAKFPLLMCPAWAPSPCRGWPATPSDSRLSGYELSGGFTDSIHTLLHFFIYLCCWIRFVNGASKDQCVDFPHWDFWN